MTAAPFDPVELLTALVAAASEGHTRRTLLRRVTEVLARWLPVVRVELAEQVDDELEVLAATPGGATVASARQPLAGDVARRCAAVRRSNAARAADSAG
jgi:hypothetical protein